MEQESNTEVLVRGDDFAWLEVLLAPIAMEPRKKKKILSRVSGGLCSSINETESQEDDEIDVMSDDPTEQEELDEEILEDNRVSCEKDLFRRYMDDASKWKILSAEEERSLAIKKEAGDKQAYDLLVKHNLRLVVRIAKWYIGKGLPLEDLIQEGNLGLMRGAEKFRAEEGFRFSTYAAWWIRQKIERALSDKARTIRLPVYISDLLRRRKRMCRKLTDTSGNPPKFENLSTELYRSHSTYRERSFKVFCNRLRKAEEIVEDMFSLDYMTGEDKDATLIDFIDSSKPSPEDILADAEINRKLIEPVLACLTKREAEIIRRRFGFDGNEETLEEIGDSLSLSRERIRQIEKMALRKVRFHFYSQKQRKAEALTVIRGA